MPSPLTERRTLVELTAALHAAGLVDPADPLAGAELLVGWESAVVRTTDGWIHRFSRMEPGAFDRELAILALVDGRLGVPTPRVERIGYADLVMVYRTITGDPFDLAGVVEQTRAERAELTRSLATVLASMHDLTAEVVDRIEIPMADHTGMADEVRMAAARHSGWVREQLVKVLAAWDDCALAHPGDSAVLLHGDFHSGNMVFASPSGPLAGLWDFSCVERGDPADDFRYLVGSSADLAVETAEHYTALTGRPVDLDAARRTAVLEDLADALAEDRPLGEVLENRLLENVPDLPTGHLELGRGEHPGHGEQCVVR